ncbi:MAG: nucleoside kinase [Fusobacterium perfoetens]|uniref:nucleoside kinase n=1 Tax=Fusobacterium perfoetens TaxID=852 RepID=UPI0023F0A32F|nr:nucleoside kinase [Fusobacterium perfoetens]MCI6153233.1 nucleoside kinase [Fusobacterium perfoetens]MDY3238334.1 nucleoside kinase [Fusobacterium perfoetens]
MSKILESKQYETIKLVFLKAMWKLYPDYDVEIQNSLNNGSYGEVYFDGKLISLTKKEYEKIKNEMKKIINDDIPIEMITDNIEVLKEKGKNILREDIKELLKNCGWAKIKEYKVGDYTDYFYLMPEKRTGKVKDFDLYKYNNGFILKTPMEIYNWEIAPMKDTPKIAKAFQEGNAWEKIMGINFAGSINKKVFNKEIAELIMLNETLHSKKINKISNEIIENKDIKIVTIAGPSSSGKTTLSKKLRLHLQTCGIQTLAISLDDYYVGRANVPLDENGNKDFETIYALDIELLNKNLKDLIDGKETELPLYDFFTGERKTKGHKVQLEEGGIIIIEGIHGLNDELTKYIPRENKYKIYISCLTQTNMDRHNRVHTTDVRKIRRIVRDSLSRDTNGEETLKMWNSIRKGEEKWIFPFQEDADAIFNSSLSYELGILKPYAIRELIKVDIDSPQYEEAKKLVELLSCFVDIESSLVPSDSILKEFIGGSVFYNY